MIQNESPRSHGKMGVFPDDEKEHVGVVLLDSANHVLGYHPLSTGSLDLSIVSPRMVFAPAVRTMACSRVVLIHNHPSGDPEATRDDIRLTQHLVRAGRMLDVHVIDHVILGVGESYSSLAQEGLIRDESHKDSKT